MAWTATGHTMSPTTCYCNHLLILQASTLSEARHAATGCALAHLKRDNSVHLTGCANRVKNTPDLDIHINQNENKDNRKACWFTQFSSSEFFTVNKMWQWEIRTIGKTTEVARGTLQRNISIPFTQIKSSMMKPSTCDYATLVNSVVKCSKELGIILLLL